MPKTVSRYEKPVTRKYSQNVEFWDPNWQQNRVICGTHHFILFLSLNLQIYVSSFKKFRLDLGKCWLEPCFQRSGGANLIWSIVLFEITVWMSKNVCAFSLEFFIFALGLGRTKGRHTAVMKLSFYNSRFGF